MYIYIYIHIYIHIYISEFQELLESRDLSAFFVYTLSTLKGHRPDVGDICIPGEFNLKGPSTLSSRSTDQVALKAPLTLY
jgi:hypothetical protein